MNAQQAQFVALKFQRIKLTLRPKLFKQIHRKIFSLVTVDQLPARAGIKLLLPQAVCQRTITVQIRTEALLVTYNFFQFISHVVLVSLTLDLLDHFFPPTDEIMALQQDWSALSYQVSAIGNMKSPIRLGYQKYHLFIIWCIQFNHLITTKTAYSSTLAI